MKVCLNGRGITSVTSTSKIRKITPSKKNFIQNRIRLLPNGSRPHSNGLFFSLLNSLLYLINCNRQRNNVKKIILNTYILTWNIYIQCAVASFVRFILIIVPKPTAPSQALMHINIKPWYTSKPCIIIDKMIINLNSSSLSKTVNVFFLKLNLVKINNKAKISILNIICSSTYHSKLEMASLK